MISMRVAGEQEATLAPLVRRREFDDASALYQRVFGYDGRFSLNTKLMLAMRYAGGATIGAWSPTGELVGFVYGFPAVDHQHSYLFSQAACVAQPWRGRGVGTALKRAQMEEARRQGLPTMRWAFDPTNVRNAQINIDKLGARARWFKTDFYDDGASDRLIVEWDGTSAHVGELRAVDAAPELFGHAQVLHDGRFAIPVPETGPMPAATREVLSATLRHLIGAGGVITRCAPVSPGVLAYICEGGGDDHLES